MGARTRNAKAASQGQKTDDRDPVCLLAVNDVMALGAITAMRSLGLSVPGDVQVGDFDDIPTLRDYAPASTTFRLPLELSKKAIEMALAAEPTGPVTVDGKLCCGRALAEPLIRDRCRSRVLARV